MSFHLPLFSSPGLWPVSNLDRSQKVNRMLFIKQFRSRQISHNTPVLLYKSPIAAYYSCSLVMATSLHVRFRWWAKLLSNCLVPKRMIKNRGNSVRTKDEDGYTRRAGCVCFRTDQEKEVRHIWFLHMAEHMSRPAVRPDTVMLMFVHCRSY